VCVKENTIEEMSSMIKTNSKATINVLCCTANIGNEEPDLASIRSWIPIDGLTSKALNKQRYPLKKGGGGGTATTRGRMMTRRFQDAVKDFIQQHNDEDKEISTSSLMLSNPNGSSDDDDDDDNDDDDDDDDDDADETTIEDMTTTVLQGPRFDIIAIGMQEATFERKISSSSLSSNVKAINNTTNGNNNGQDFHHQKSQKNHGPVLKKLKQVQTVVTSVDYNSPSGRGNKNSNKKDNAIIGNLKKLKSLVLDDDNDRNESETINSHKNSSNNNSKKNKSKLCHHNSTSSALTSSSDIGGVESENGGSVLNTNNTNNAMNSSFSETSTSASSLILHQPNNNKVSTTVVWDSQDASTTTGNTSPPNDDSKKDKTITTTTAPATTALSNDHAENVGEEDTRYLHTTLRRHLPSYTRVVSFQRGQMRLLIYYYNNKNSTNNDDNDDNNNCDKSSTTTSTSTSNIHTFDVISVKAQNTGRAGLANKGGIVAECNINNGTRISFLTAHLEAHEGIAKYNTRCSTIGDILRGTQSSVVTDFGCDVSLSSHYMFVMGTLYEDCFGDGVGVIYLSFLFVCLFVCVRVCTSLSLRRIVFGLHSTVSSAVY
jgi:hypothetical protein